MRLHAVALGAGLLGATAISAQKNGLPVDKVYGVNLGSWLLSEPWMFPNEWKSMGGEICDDCSKCAAHEYGLVKKLGQSKADKVFAKHWSTWFTQANVNAIADAKLNTVRIPLGYWIVEDLVDRSNEFYPRGGLPYLKQGLRMLKAKGINVILDLHALPGVAAPNQMFAGRCTSDVQFYTERNYNRALKWASVMTTLIFKDPDFSTVFALEAINEPVMDANQTPGYGDYQKNFVKTVRGVELSLGIRCPNFADSKVFTNPGYTSAIGKGLRAMAQFADPTIADVLKFTADTFPRVASQLNLTNVQLSKVIGTGNTGRALKTAPAPVNGTVNQMKLGHGAGRIGGQLGAHGPIKVNLAARSEQLVPRLNVAPHGSILERHAHRRRQQPAICKPRDSNLRQQCLMTTFMNKDWQYNNPPNPADAAMGPQLYDSHLYFNFGGVADPNPDSYMRTICNTDRVQSATSEGNRPLVFGEWSLATNFDASNQFVKDWSDAQRFIYAGQADGWIFWSFKIEPGSVYIPAWSYFDALKAGYFTKDPSKLANPNICAPWIANKNRAA